MLNISGSSVWDLGDFIFDCQNLKKILYEPFFTLKIPKYEKLTNRTIVIFQGSKITLEEAIICSQELEGLREEWQSWIN